MHLSRRRVRIVLRGGALTDAFRRNNQPRASGQRCDLRLACPLQRIYLYEGIRDRAAARQQPMMAQNYRLVSRSEIGNQPLALVEIKSEAFVNVIGNSAIKLQGVL